MAETVDKFISACLKYIKETDKEAAKPAVVEAAATAASENEDVKKVLDNNTDADELIKKLPDILKIKEYTTTDNNIYIKKSDNNEYHAINITTGNVWTVSAKDVASATFGGKKSKTHRQKKVHRSTQKRNGRKRTSHRRK
jgi:hypothetical protein